MFEVWAEGDWANRWFKTLEKAERHARKRTARNGNRSYVSDDSRNLILLTTRDSLDRVWSNLTEYGSRHFL